MKAQSKKFIEDMKLLDQILNIMDCHPKTTAEINQILKLQLSPAKVNALWRQTELISKTKVIRPTVNKVGVASNQELTAYMAKTL